MKITDTDLINWLEKAPVDLDRKWGDEWYITIIDIGILTTIKAKTLREVVRKAMDYKER